MVGLDSEALLARLAGAGQVGQCWLAGSGWPGGGGGWGGRGGWLGGARRVAGWQGAGLLGLHGPGVGNVHIPEIVCKDHTPNSIRYKSWRKILGG